MLSPFSATFALPLNIADENTQAATAAAASDLRIFFGYIGWSILYNGVLILVMMRLFQVRWRVAD